MKSNESRRENKIYIRTTTTNITNKQRRDFLLLSVTKTKNKAIDSYWLFDLLWYRKQNKKKQKKKTFERSIDQRERERSSEWKCHKH